MTKVNITAAELSLKHDYLRGVAGKFLSETNVLSLHRDLTYFLIDVEEAHQAEIKKLNGNNSDDELNKFADIIFIKAYKLGCFFQDVDEKDNAKRLFHSDIEDGCATKKMREMLNTINIRG